MSHQTRRKFSAEEKAALLRQHLVDKKPVSDVCDEHGIQPSVFSRVPTDPAERVLQRAGGKARARDRIVEGKAREEGQRDRGGVGRVCTPKKRTWGALTGRWVPPDTRDEVVDFVTKWSATTELPATRFAAWLGVARGKYYAWKDHYGRAHEHNGKIPRDHWIEAREREAILDYFDAHPLDGYRRLSFMMLDEDVVAVSPSTAFRTLRDAGRLDRFNGRPSKKGSGFVQPDGAHKHWHIDISYLNLAGTFYYLCSILDGYSRFIVHWEIRESMKESEVETILQRAREKFPDARPRIISDNGPQFIARDFKAFIRLSGMTHVRTAPYYPQSNGKIEAWHKTLKTTTIRPNAPASVDDARRLVASFVTYYNDKRLHSATGYIAPADKLAGREHIIWTQRDAKLEAARELRRQRRAQLREIPA